MFKNFKTKTTASNILIISAFFLLGILIGFHNQPAIGKIIGVSNKENPINVETDFSPFWKAWNLIDEKYPGASKITNEERLYGAISGLVGSLKDPYSVFFNPEDAKSFQDDIAGSFSGIGAEVGMKDGILTVIAPLKDSPAYKAGLKAGDRILNIDKTSTSDLSTEEAVRLMRGEKGTTVTLTVFREGDEEAREVKIVRDIIDVPVINTELRKDGVFVISLYSFSENSAKLFRNAIKEFSESNTDKLVLDLRGNPGGYLDAAVDMASWFLPAGKTVVIEDYSSDKKQRIYRSEGYNIFNKDLKFAILIDEGSASASEILAGAMQDYGIAKLVGAQSFGKGSVQEVVGVTDDTIMKITIAKWLTPNGQSISEKGLTPDYKVKITKKDAEKKIDSQLEKAVEVLNNWSK
ncbi:MAG TPA: S41 family peptidase [Candidatus Paceibacterota bacterium]|nr:S41 family peptidase [Candidatus Paceibacterota bacterium]HPT18405.1 S41 family peptidase [Candidatus Paceibacterota bacterium]